MSVNVKDYEVRELLKELLVVVKNIRYLLIKPKTLHIEWFIGAKLQMATNPIPLPSTQKATGVVIELNNDGSNFKFDPTKIAVAVKDQTILTAAVDPTTGNITITPVAAGSTDVVVADTATGIQSPIYTFTVTQTGPTPASLSVAWTVA